MRDKMDEVRDAVFPGFIIGSIFVFLLGFWVANPRIVWASSNPSIAEEEVGQSAENASIERTSSESCGISSNYPETIQRWCSLIEQSALKNNLDPNLVAALILQESGGDDRAYSYSGAVGLMQVMPRDGLAANFICPNGPCFANRPSSEELYQPEFNIHFGTEYLGNLVKIYGETREALRAYGPMDVGYSYADLVLAIYGSY
jgi:hypothetical protein